MLRTRRLIGVVLIAASVPTLLAACGGGDIDDSALARTKAPAQLLRNTVAALVPSSEIAKLGTAKDISVDCGDDGIKRSWLSTQLIYVLPSSAGVVEGIAEGVADSLTKDGWISSLSDPSDTQHLIKLTSKRTTSTIALLSDKGSTVTGPTFSVAVTGPCVTTDGPNSDEVKHLENRS